MKLSVNLFTTFDGVSQGPGSPDEDPRGGFSRGGWLLPVFDEDCGEIVDSWFERSGALLLGRRTLDTFASYWPSVTDPEDKVADRINNHQKYVVTSAPLGNTWRETTTVLGAGFREEITQLKAQESDLELQIHGSIRLARALHQAGLVDIYRFLVAPVILGQGARVFDGDGPAYAMNIESSTTTSSGVHSVEFTPQDFAHSLRPCVQDGHDAIVDA